MIDRYRVPIIGALGAGLLAQLVMLASAKPFWHDEVYTILTSQVPLHSLWAAYRDGIDLAPPLNSFVSRGVHALFGVGLVSTRLPAMAGLLIAMFVIFLMVRRRTNALMGFVAALLLCSTPAWQFGIEARAPGLSLALFALALYGWSEAASGRRPALYWSVMAAALAAGVWNHYYAVLAFVPIAIGETVRQISRRRFELAPWAAMAAAGVCLLPLLSLAAVGYAQRSTFWGHHDSEPLGETYRFVLGKRTGDVIAGVALVAAIIGESIRRVRAGKMTRRLPAHDLAACLACLALPAAAVLIGNWMEIFTKRYVVFAIVGFAFAIPQLVWWLTPANGLGDVIAAIAVVVSLVSVTSRTLQATWQDPLADRPLLLDWAKRPGGIVLTGGVTYLSFWYHLPPDVRPRVFGVADPDAQLKLTGSDTSDRGYLALARWTPVPILPVRDFVAQHQRFVLYAIWSSWIEWRLRTLGARFTELAREPSGSGILYEVEMGTTR